MTILQDGVELAVPHAQELFIGGEWVDPSTDAAITVVNPSNEYVIGDFPDVGLADVDKAVAAARNAFDHGPWRRLSVAERATRLRRFTDALLAKRDDAGLAWSAETGPTAQFRDAINALVVPTILEDSYDQAASFVFSDERTGFAGPVSVLREPYGVAVTILTYNGPLAYTAIKVLPALLAGNVVILKLPIETRLVSQFISEAAADADLPAGVLSVLPASVAGSKYLVEHSGIDVISFTGGTAVGSQILRSASDRLVKTTLELGGKSAAIIADDIPSEQLLPALLPGMLPFQGQVCVATTRLLVSRGRHDEIVDALSHVFGSLRIGNALEQTTDFGPLAISRTRDRCEYFVGQAVAEGASVAYGGKRPDGLDKGFYFEPTLLTDVKNSMTVAQEEVFGPVFAVITYDDIDDAIAIANDSPYGLTGAVFTNDDDLAWKVGRELQAGSVTKNSTGGVLGQAFGGYKKSGIGREMGQEGFAEWLQTKVVKINDTGNYL